MFQLQLFFLLHCDEWDRVVALPRNKFVTGATLLQLVLYGYSYVFSSSNKTYRHDITELLSKVAFNTINHQLYLVQRKRIKTTGQNNSTNNETSVTLNRNLLEIDLTAQCT